MAAAYGYWVELSISCSRPASASPCGVWRWSASWSREPLWWERLGAFAAGVLLVLALPVTDELGFLLGAAIVGLHWWRSRQAQPRPRLERRLPPDRRKSMVVAASAFHAGLDAFVQKTRWEEDCRLTDAGLELVEARIEGSGGGWKSPTEPPATAMSGATARSFRPQPALLLARSGATGGGWGSARTAGASPSERMRDRPRNSVAVGKPDPPPAPLRRPRSCPNPCVSRRAGPGPRM